MSAVLETEQIAHQRRVNFDAAAALVVNADLTEQQAQRVIVAIAKGQVPAVRISY